MGRKQEIETTCSKIDRRPPTDFLAILRMWPYSPGNEPSFKAEKVYEHDVDRLLDGALRRKYQQLERERMRCLREGEKGAKRSSKDRAHILSKQTAQRQR